VWATNLPEEIPFYLKRQYGAWNIISWCLGIFHFAVPFVLMLFRHVKLNPYSLRAVALGLLVICAIDVTWWIEAAYLHDIPLFWLMDIAAIVGIGGLWGWFFISQIKGRPLVPACEAVFVESAHGH
jgi:hypothetical protein